MEVWESGFETAEETGEAAAAEGERVEGCVVVGGGFDRETDYRGGGFDEMVGEEEVQDCGFAGGVEACEEDGAGEVEEGLVLRCYGGEEAGPVIPGMGG